jgi:hypothetical protein
MYEFKKIVILVSGNGSKALVLHLTEVLGFDTRRGLGIFLFITASGMALRPTVSPIQWVRVCFSGGKATEA